MKRLSGKTVYQDKWLTHQIDQVRLSDGSKLDCYHTIKFPSASSAVILVNKLEQILFVELYRYPIGSVSLEIPAGSLNLNEEPLTGALRELLEETGYCATELKLLGLIYPMNDISDKTIYIFYGKLNESNQPSNNIDFKEINAIHWLSLEQVKELLSDNTIKDSMTISALGLYVLKNKSS